jgi:hypothetical protein
MAATASPIPTPVPMGPTPVITVVPEKYVVLVPVVSQLPPPVLPLVADEISLQVNVVMA